MLKQTQNECVCVCVYIFVYENYVVWGIQNLQWKKNKYYKPLYNRLPPSYDHLPKGALCRWIYKPAVSLSAASVRPNLLCYCILVLVCIYLQRLIVAGDCWCYQCGHRLTAGRLYEYMYICTCICMQVFKYLHRLPSSSIKSISAKYWPPKVCCMNWKSNNMSRWWNLHLWWGTCACYICIHMYKHIYV